MKLGKLARLMVVLPAAVLMVACNDDPTADGSGEAFAIVSNIAETSQVVNGTFTITARVVDRLGTSLPVEVTAASSKADVARIDSTRFLPELQETRIFAKALKKDAAGADITLSGAGLTYAVKVLVP